MRRPVLSLLIPVYNSAPYLKRCLDSVINQSYKQLEIICVDDGSTDDSLEILNEYQKNDSRVKVFHQENKGVLAAKKRCMEESSGEYIGYVDSDDWVEPEMYDDMISRMWRYDLDIVCCDYYRDYESHSIESHQRYKDGEYDVSEVVDGKKGMGIAGEIEPGVRNINFFLWSKVYRRSIIYDNQMLVPDGICDGDDTAVVLPSILSSKKIGFVGKCYYHYCIRESSVSRDINDSDCGYEILFDYLYRRFKPYMELYPTVMNQLKVIKMEHLLLGNPERIICYRDGELIPFGKIKEGTRIIAYGAGRFGVAAKCILENMEEIALIGWVDQNNLLPGVKRLGEVKFDDSTFFVITILQAEAIAKVKKTLLEAGVNENRILSVHMDYYKKIDL